MRRLVLLFLVGAVLGTFGDSLHVTGGVLAYPAPTILGEKPWVPLLMGFSFIGLVEGYAFWRARWPAPEQTVSTAAMTAGCGSFLALWGATAVFWDHPIALTLALIALYLCWPGALRPRVLLHALGVTLIGPGVEATLSSTGAFQYLTGHLFLGVPMWLPAFYLHAAMVGRFVALRFPSAMPWARAATATMPAPDASR